MKRKFAFFLIYIYVKKIIKLSSYQSREEDAYKIIKKNLITYQIIATHFVVVICSKINRDEALRIK